MRIHSNTSRGGPSGKQQDYILLRHDHSLFKGVIETLRVSPRLLILETMRRIMKRPYRYGCARITDGREFRSLRILLEKKIDIHCNNGWYRITLDYGSFEAPKLTMFLPAVNDIEKYSVVDYKDAVVVDIGGYIGESSIFFARSGARRVVTYEPVFYDILQRNIKSNNIENIKVVPKGVSHKKTKVCVKISYGRTGIEHGSHCFETEPLGQIIESNNPDIIKMDCEGCEYALLTLPCEKISTVKHWIIELHGPEQMFLTHMRDCGFNAGLLEKEIVCGMHIASLWHFHW